MAGYRRAGDSEFVNATVFNSQGDRQREAASRQNAARETGSRSSLLGVGRNDNDNSVFPQLDKQVIFQQAVDFFANADVEVDSRSGENPDFVGIVPMDSRGSFEMFNDIENQIDLPNKLGPNMVVPNVNNLSEPTTTQVGRSDDQLNRGFGSEKRYEEGTDTIGTFFRRHYQFGEQQREQEVKKGKAFSESGS